MKKPKLTLAKLFGSRKESANVTNLIFKNAGVKPATAWHSKPAVVTRPGKGKR